jgi:hypothetical protein
VDHQRFDHLARILTTLGSRRQVLGVLASVPLGSGLLQILDPAEIAAKDRRRRRKHRHKRRKEPGSRNHGDKRDGKKRSKPQRSCTPDSIAQTCDGRCGSVQNNCQQPVDCGSCACEPACGACFTCQDERNTPGMCVFDPAQQGKPCGDPGQVCLAGGVCACDATSCDAPDTCGGGGVDGACGCTPTTCAAEDAECGTIDSGCGPTLDCGACPYPSQQCNDNTCSACVPTTCAAAGADCGVINDGCGGQLNCDMSCTSKGFVCRNNVCSFPCPPGPFC